MSKITKSARNQDCQVQLYGICNHNSETTVFAHYRKGGFGGMGKKPDDLFGAYACSSCHDEIDRRTRVLENEHVDHEFLQAILRTQRNLLANGLIEIKG